MEYARIVKEKFIENNNKVSLNKNIGFPWYEVYPRLGKYIPVLPPGVQIAITAGSGVGKSNSWVGMILMSMYKIKKKNPEKEYKFRLLIALLEDSIDKLITMLFSAILMDKYKMRVDSLMLMGMRENPLSEEVRSKLNDVELEINELLKNCEIIDSIYNPTGLYKWARAISNKLGTHHYKEVDFTDEKGGIYKQTVYSHYEPNDPEEQIIFIVDNLNNLEQEKDKDSGILLSERETINRWTRKYGRLQITKHWNWTLINIIQQASDSEKPQYDYKGNLVIDKIKPSLDGFGGSKECQRDHVIVFGLFNPSRYGIIEYPENNGYNISRLKDAYRSFIILKSNICETNKEIPLYFDGACSLYKEYPLPRDMTEAIYKQIEKERK